MPALIVAAAAAFASWGAAAGAVSLGLVVAGSIGATIIGSVAGLVIAVAGSMLLSSMTKKPTVPDYAQDRKQAIRSAIEPMRVVYGRTMVSGPVVYMGSSGSQSEYLHIVVPVAGHVIDDFEEVWINDKQIVLAAAGVGGMDALDRAGGALSGTVRIHTYDGTQTAADAALVTDCASDWTSAHVLEGIPYMYLRILYRRDIIESFNTVKAVVRGKPVLDCRDDTTAYSNNAALCILDYITSTYGIGADIDTEIDTSYWSAAANICDETVSLVSGGGTTEPRFTLNGSFKLDQAPIDITEGLLSSCGGAITYIGGAYRLHVAAYESPSLTLTTAAFAGNIRVSPKPPRRSLINRVQGTYIDEAQQWSAVSFPPVVVSDFEDEDGETIVHDAEFPHVTSRAQVQRLARIALLRARQGLTVEVPLKLTGQQIAAWSTIGLTVSAFGWSNKAFRIQSWKFDPVSSVITITAQEEYASSYSWTYLDLGPDLSEDQPTLVSPLDLVAPTSLTLTPTTALQGDGGTVPALLVEWTAPANPYATATEVQWRADGESDWSSIEVPAPTAKVILSPLLSGVDYDVRVRSRSALFLSDWTATETDTVAPDTTAPSVPGSPSATGISTGISLSWTKPTESDFVAVEVWENTTNNLGTAYYVAQSTGSGYLRSGLGGGALRYYWMRSYDRSGNQSSFTSVVSATSGKVATDDLNSGAVSVLYSDKETDSISIADGTLYTVMAVTVVVPDGSSRVRFQYMVDMYQGALPGDSGTSAGGGEGDGGGGGES
jgi:hypothetical protein